MIDKLLRAAMLFDLEGKGYNIDVIDSENCIVRIHKRSPDVKFDGAFKVTEDGDLKFHTFPNSKQTVAFSCYMNSVQNPMEILRGFQEVLKNS